MADILTFTLWAPMAAMGDIAVGERRVGHTRPARSAILGLVAAALGIERTDAARLAAVEAGYGLALLVERVGDLLQDYHSTQLPKRGRDRRKATRRDELADPERLNTILTWREYRTEPWVTAALWAREPAPRTLADLEDALERPRFTLYFGRKACPLGLPPAPLLDGSAASLADAFFRREQKRSREARRLRDRLHIVEGRGTLYADRDATLPGGPGLGRAHALFDMDAPKLWEPALGPGDRLAFSLRANPVVTRKDAAGKSRRYDVVMDRLHAVPHGERAPVRNETVREAGLNWLEQQGKRHGFAIGMEEDEDGEERPILRIDGYEQLRIRREGKPAPARFSVVEFDGIRRVEAPEAFLAAVAAGFGKAKAWGCGLMLLRRA